MDARVLAAARNGPGRIIRNEEEVGGWPPYASGQPPADTANDGIPDLWKQAHGLALNDPKTAGTTNSEGYTELEVYLNSLVHP